MPARAQGWAVEQVDTRTDANGQPVVRITGSQGSGVLRSMSEANCMVVLHHQQGSVHAGEAVDVDELARAQRIVPIVSVQNRYNVADRSSEDVLEYCTRERIAFIPWAPLARGESEALADKGHAEAFTAVATARGIDAFQLALSWLLAKSPVMLPIPGTSKVAHLEQNIAAAEVTLSEAQFAALSEAT